MTSGNHWDTRWSCRVRHGNDSHGFIFGFFSPTESLEKMVQIKPAGQVFPLLASLLRSSIILTRPGRSWLITLTLVIGVAGKNDDDDDDDDDDLDKKFFCLFDFPFWVEYEDVSFVTFSTSKFYLLWPSDISMFKGLWDFWGYLTLLLAKNSGSSRLMWGRYILLKFAEAVEMVKCVCKIFACNSITKGALGPFPFEALASLFALDGSSLPLSRKKQRKGRWWRWLGISCSFLTVGPTQKKDWLAFISWK